MKSKGFYNNIKKYSTPPQLLLDSSSETDKPHRRNIGKKIPPQRPTSLIGDPLETVIPC